MTIRKTRYPEHDPSRCHKCMRGQTVTLEMSKHERRALCNELAAAGWSVDYLAHRFHLTPKDGGLI